MKTVSLVSFDRKASLIVIPVTIKTEIKVWEFRFAVDTGATISLIDADVMKRLGYTTVGIKLFQKQGIDNRFQIIRNTIEIIHGAISTSLSGLYSIFGTVLN